MGQTFFRAAAILVFAGLILTIWINHGKWEIQNAFLLYALAAVMGGIIFVTMILPHLGDIVSTAVLSSGEEIEKDPFQKAHARVARGEYREAIEEFRRLAAAEPGNRRPIAEMAKIYLDKLHDPDGAIRTLEEALHASGWSEDDESFYLFRLVDLTLEHRHDTEHAVDLLKHVVERFPDSRHSANAVHRLRELDRTALASLSESHAAPEGPAPETLQPEPSAIPKPDIAKQAPTSTPPKPDLM